LISTAAMKEPLVKSDLAAPSGSGARGATRLGLDPAWQEDRWHLRPTERNP
jgi:hypothetical protein